MRPSFLVLTAILLVVFLSFSPSLKGQFVNWDDDVHLLQNPLVRSLTPENIKKIFTTRVIEIYVPLTVLSFALEYHFFRLAPFVYHLDNLILHLAVTGMVFFLGRRLGLSLLAAGTAGLLFGIHPVHVESVAWVSERKDVLYAFFYLLALHSYLSYLKGVLAKEKRRFRKFLLLAGVTLWGTLSLLAKPMAVSLPLILLLLDWFYRRKISLPVLIEKVPLLISAAAIGAMTYLSYARIPGENPGQAALIWIWTFVFYFRHFLFPVYLVPVPPLPEPVSLHNPEYLLTLSAFVMIITAWVVFRRSRWVLFSAGFYFLSLFFLLKFDRFDIHIVGDRYLYLSSIGFCFLAGRCCDVLLGTKTASRLWKGVFFAGIAAVFLLFGSRTFSQCRVWQNSMTLWRHQLVVTPNNEIALHNLACAYGQQEFFPRMISQYRALCAEPKQSCLDTEARSPHLPLIRHIIGLYEKALALDPDYYLAAHNFSGFYFELGEYQRAEKISRYRLSRDPHDAQAYFRLGEIYRVRHEPSRAAINYLTALIYDPTHPELYVRTLLALNQGFQQTREDIYAQARGIVFRVSQEMSRHPLIDRYTKDVNKFILKNDGAGLEQYYRQLYRQDPVFHSAVLQMEKFRDGISEGTVTPKW